MIFKKEKKKKRVKMTRILAESVCHVYLSVKCPFKKRPASRQTNVWDVIHNKHTCAVDLTFKESRHFMVLGQGKKPQKPRETESLEKAILNAVEYWKLKILGFCVLWLLSRLINILREILEGNICSAESCEVFLGKQDLKLFAIR